MGFGGSVTRIPGFLQPTLGDLITSHRTRSLRRHAHNLWESLRGVDGAVEWYHDAGDPWSGLLAQVLQEFRDRFDVPVRPYTVSAIESPYRVEADRFFSYALHDSRLLAEFHGLQKPEHLPERQDADSVNALLCDYEQDIDEYLDVAVQSHQQLFHEASPVIPHRTSRQPRINRKRLEDRGHYQSGMLHYHGEWFWGIDRLPLLEQILRKERRGNGSCVFTYPEQVEPWKGDTIECYFSFRSPYSYIALPRIYDVADRYDLELVLKPVLPMVNRGLEVPFKKKRYILLDTAREAYRHNIVFGRIRDPLGQGVENAIAVFSTLTQDYKRQFAWSAMNGAWARGLNLAKQRDLEKVAIEAGVEGWQVEEALATDAWRRETEENLHELMDLGMWGVPAFKLGDHFAWGQDRIPILRAGVARARTDQQAQFEAD
jgi:2-hydroxychromene-2-carboxylate isomerase